MENEDWKNEITNFLREFNIKFSNIDLYIEAFTHSSYVYERNDIECNERLEFLGDAILGKEISEYLFDSEKSREGKLTIMKSEYVNNDNLFRISKEMGIDKILRIGNGLEEKSNKMIGDALEALVGAIYKDSEDECKKFIEEHFLPQKK